MIKGGKGGANTNLNGLKFEKETDIKILFQKIHGYKVINEEIYFQDKKVAELFSKNSLYKKLLTQYGINWKTRASSKLLPDEAIFILKDNTLYVIEKKIQNGSGSVDEKLQTCDFKKKKYIKLLTGTNIKVEFIYVLNNWFDQERNKDTFDYIKAVGCHYFFNTLPLSFLNLPKSN